MARYKGHRCRVCGEFDHVVGKLSARGKCSKCGQRALDENVAQMQAKEGRNWQRQQAAWRASGAPTGRSITPAPDEPQRGLPDA